METEDHFCRKCGFRFIEVPVTKQQIFFLTAF
jgi:C4-type Zn-finger protein